MNQPPSTCFHGGAFFAAIGEEFDHLGRHCEIVNADVLDAWFPPSPQVLATLTEHLPWILRTSPPTDCGGMVRVIAATRGVAPDCILPAAGSSALIFLAFSNWLHRGARVLLLDPSYGEYAHVLERVIGCDLHRLPLHREARFQPDLQRLAEMANSGVDMIVLVNPNSPTGRHIPRQDLVDILASIPKRTRVWVDETYVEYVDPAGGPHSLETFAASSDHVVVCKSMSKCYALSGARAAYLCAAPKVLQPLRRQVPPWAVSLPAQIAAVRALQDPEYYAARYHETRILRERLVQGLTSLAPMTIVPSSANFVLCELDRRGPTAAQVVERCAHQGVFLRDASNMGQQLDAHDLRIAVKNPADTDRILQVLDSALR